MTPVIARKTMHNPKIDVAVANQTDAALDEARLVDAVRASLAAPPDSKPPFSSGEVSVAVVDDETIQRLNRQFLDHDYSTDVLSFLLLEESGRIEGEIVASIDTARREAADVGWDWHDELVLYVVHGALHLTGYRDETPCAMRAMRAAESGVLATLGVNRSRDDDRWTNLTIPIAIEPPRCCEEPGT